MLVRPLSRALAVATSACALGLVSAGAAAADPNPSVTPGNVTSGTDVAAPDQQNPIPPATQPVAQQAPTWASNPQTLTPLSAATTSADAGFQWDDAGIGAGGALVVVLAGLGGTLAIRRRQVSDPPLAA
jgi:hypothetical protein